MTATPRPRMSREETTSYLLGTDTSNSLPIHERELVAALAADYIALLDAYEQVHTALQHARPVVAGRSCWHDDPDVDCCDCPAILGLIDAALDSAAGNDSGEG